MASLVAVDAQIVRKQDDPNEPRIGNLNGTFRNTSMFGQPNTNTFGVPCKPFKYDQGQTPRPAQRYSSKQPFMNNSEYFLKVVKLTQHTDCLNLL